MLAACLAVWLGLLPASAGEIDDARDNAATVIQNYVASAGEGGAIRAQPPGAAKPIALRFVGLENETLRSAGGKRYQVFAKFASGKGRYEALFIVDMGDEWKVESVRWPSRAEAEKLKNAPAAAAPAEAEAASPAAPAQAAPAPAARADGKAYKPEGGTLASAASSLDAPPPGLRLRPGSSIVIYGPAELLAVRTAEESLKLRGLDSTVTPMKTREDLQDILPRLKAAGLVSADERVAMPFYEVDGKLFSAAAVDAGLSRMPLTNAKDQDGSYIVVYGLSNCPFTSKGRRELDQADIPYEFRDVNDPRNRPRFEALLKAYGISSFLWPVLDINGKVYSKPSLETVRAQYR